MREPSHDSGQVESRSCFVDIRGSVEVGRRRVFEIGEDPGAKPWIIDLRERKIKVPRTIRDPRYRMGGFD